MFKFLTNKGELKNYTIDYNIDIKSLLNNDINIAPFEYNKQNISLVPELKKQNIKYIKTNIKPDFNTKILICYKNNKYKSDAILYSYISNNFFIQETVGSILNPLDFILNRLQGINNKYLKLKTLRMYILISKDLSPLLYNIEKNNTITSTDRYIMKYNIIQNYDNFIDFEKKYKILIKEANLIQKKIINTIEYQNYAKNIKIKSF